MTDDDFLIGLAHPDATKLRVGSKTLCARERALSVVVAAVAVIGKRPAQRKALCTIGAGATSALDPTSDAAAKDAIAALGKACM